MLCAWIVFDVIHAVCASFKDKINIPVVTLSPRRGVAIQTYGLRASADRPVVFLDPRNKSEDDTLLLPQLFPPSSHAVIFELHPPSSSNHPPLSSSNTTPSSSDITPLSSSDITPLSSSDLFRGSIKYSHETHYTYLMGFFKIWFLVIFMLNLTMKVMTRSQEWQEKREWTPNKNLANFWSGIPS